MQAAEARDPRGVVVPISPEFALREQDAIEDDEDSNWLTEMLEKSIGELFVDHLIMPLMGLAMVSILLLIISAATWGSLELLRWSWVLL